MIASVCRGDELQAVSAGLDVPTERVGVTSYCRP